MHWIDAAICFPKISSDCYYAVSMQHSVVSPSDTSQTISVVPPVVSPLVLL